MEQKKEMLLAELKKIEKTTEEYWAGTGLDRKKLIECLKKDIECCDILATIWKD